MSGDVKSDLDTLELNQLEQLEDCHIKILIIQQYITLYGENIYPTRLLFQYKKSLSNIDKIKAFI